MTEEMAREVAGIGVRLLDDAYVAWLAAESECERALKSWFNGSSRTSSAAYLSYRAALDREEAAANDLRRLSRLAQPCRESLAGEARSVTQPKSASN
jgi:hypothetical protein